MATHSTENRNGHPRTTVQMKPGERISLCRCFGSKKFPLCDGTHKEYPGRGPVVIEVMQETTIQSETVSVGQGVSHT